MTVGKRIDFIAARLDERLSTSSVTLDGRAYFVEALFRRWDRAWMITLATAAGAPIIDGAIANDGEDVLGPVVVEGRPPGRLVVRDTSGKHRDPDFTDWRSGVELVYIPSS